MYAVLCKPYRIVVWMNGIVFTKIYIHTQKNGEWQMANGKWQRKICARQIDWEVDNSVNHSKTLHALLLLFFFYIHFWLLFYLNHFVNCLKEEEDAKDGGEGGRMEGKHEKCDSPSSQFTMLFHYKRIQWIFNFIFSHGWYRFGFHKHQIWHDNRLRCAYCMRNTENAWMFECSNLSQCHRVIALVAFSRMKTIWKLFRLFYDSTTE